MVKSAVGEKDVVVSAWFVGAQQGEAAQTALRVAVSLRLARSEQRHNSVCLELECSGCTLSPVLRPFRGFELQPRDSSGISFQICFDRGLKTEFQSVLKLRL